MNLLKTKTNSFRRKVMRGLTKNIGDAHFDTINIDGDIRIGKILISRPNARLGNLLLVTPLLQEVISLFPDSKIDLFVKGNTATYIFKEFRNVDRIIALPKKPFTNPIKYAYRWLTLRRRKYDLAINVAESSSSGRLSVKLARAKFKIFGDVTNEMANQYQDYQHMAKHPVYNFRNYIEKLGISGDWGSVAPMTLNLTQSELNHGKKIMENLVGDVRKTICLFTNGTGKKCYSEEWWKAFYERLVKKYPLCAILEILPIENKSKIGFQTPTFYSKNIREIGAVIANANLFIGADSGIMHLASAVGTPTIGLFSVTNPDRYEPYNDLSAAVNTSVEDLDTCFTLTDSVLNWR